MAINVVYDVPAQLAAQAALQAGQAQYATAQQARQDQQDLAYAEMDQRAALADRELSVREKLTLLANQQQNRELSARMHQFDADRVDRAAANQQQLAYNVGRDLLQQQGYAEMRESDERMKTEQLAAEQQRYLTQEQNRMLEFYQNKRFNTAMASAEAIEKEKATLSPAQYEQAKEQWSKHFGEQVGGYPYVGPARPDRPPLSALSVKESLQSTLGSAYIEGMESFMGHEDNGQWKWDLEPAQRTDLVLGLKRDESNRLKAEQMEANRILLAEIKERQAQDELTRDRELSYRREQFQNQSRRTGYVIAGLNKLRRSPKKNRSGAFIDEGYQPNEADYNRLQREASERFPDVPLDLYGLSPSEPLTTYESEKDAVEHTQVGEVFMLDGVKMKRTGPGPEGFDVAE